MYTGKSIKTEAIKAHEKEYLIRTSGGAVRCDRNIFLSRLFHLRIPAFPQKYIYRISNSNMSNEGNSDQDQVEINRLEGDDLPTFVPDTQDDGEFVNKPEKFDLEKTLEKDRQRVVEFYGLRAPQWLANQNWERRDCIGKKKYVFIDLSGTLHIEDTPTQQAVEALRCLRVAGFVVLFVTNTTKESRRVLYERLIRIGFKLDIEEIFTSLNATRNYLEHNGLRPFMMIANEAKEDFNGISTEDPNCVLVGLSSCDFTHEIMSKAFRLLREEETKLLAIHKGRRHRTSTGMSLGPGPFVCALENATEKKAIVLGKPESEFFSEAMKFVGCVNVMDAVMIGDDIRDDVLGAMRIGITGILVETGKYSKGDEQKILPHTPDFSVKDFSTAVQLILVSTSELLKVDKRSGNSDMFVMASRICASRRLNLGF